MLLFQLFHYLIIYLFNYFIILFHYMISLFVHYFIVIIHYLFRGTPSQATELKKFSNA